MAVCKPSNDNKAVARSIIREATAKAMAEGKRCTHAMRMRVLVDWCAEHKISDRRSVTISSYILTMDFERVKDSAKKFFADNYGEKTAVVDALREKRRAGIATDAERAEFDRLYEEEGAWLDSHDIKYSPSWGWHFTKGI